MNNKCLLAEVSGDADNQAVIRTRCLNLKCVLLAENKRRAADQAEIRQDADVRRWLVVSCRDGGGNFVQEGEDGQVLGRDNRKSGDSLVFLLLTRQFVEMVAP